MTVFSLLFFCFPAISWIIRSTWGTWVWVVDSVYLTFLLHIFWISLFFFAQDEWSLPHDAMMKRVCWETAFQHTQPKFILYTGDRDEPNWQIRDMYSISERDLTVLLVTEESGVPSKLFAASGRMWRLPPSCHSVRGHLCTLEHADLIIHGVNNPVKLRTITWLVLIFK